MAQSLAQIYVHVIFSTKNREAWLKEEVWEELRPYLFTVCESQKCPAIAVGGVVDHLHLLFSLHRTTAVAGIVEKVKTSTTHWIHRRWPALEAFHWQSGYGAFSVSATNIPRIARYIQQQAEHHKKVSFQDELRKFLAAYKIDYDERYVWD